MQAKPTRVMEKTLTTRSPFQKEAAQLNQICEWYLHQPIEVSPEQLLALSNHRRPNVKSLDLGNDNASLAIRTIPPT